MTFEKWYYKGKAKFEYTDDIELTTVNAARAAWSAAWGEATKELNKLLADLEKQGKVHVHKVRYRKER